MDNVTNVCFDLDGTLTDPRVGIVRCIQHAFDRLGQPAPDERALLDWIGPPLLQSFREQLDDDLAEQALTHYRERFADSGLYENSLYTGVADVLETLKHMELRLFVATSKPTVFASRIVSHFDIARFFSRVYGSELDGRLANKGELIAHVLEAESLDPASTVMIGDRHHDIDGARENGVRAIGALWGYGSRAELAHADALCRDVLGVPEVVSG